MALTPWAGSRAYLNVPVLLAWGDRLVDERCILTPLGLEPVAVAECMYTAKSLPAVVEEAPEWKQAVLVGREDGPVPEVGFAEEVVGIQIQANLERLLHMDFPMLEQALLRLFAIQDAGQTVVEAARDSLRLQEEIGMVVACLV